jgi:predicted HTH domain antitoxin
MRGYKSLIQEAELLAMSPEAVAKFLKKRAKQSMDELDHDPG